ncbi:unnamed protein product [Microthlaspi erraticum]|uniref:Uncharacterized protein n=1 Tax=Microthlaspi erraticum TaxID=1685480 RepID=A0A6D2KN35_9BRAS|nr:unnamed protein product [Microthlaspi erraticum]
MSHAADRAQQSIREAMDRTRPVPQHAIKASGRTHRSTRKAKDYDRPRSSRHDQDHHIMADPDGRPHPLHGRPELREQEAHLCSLTILGPSYLNRLVEDLGHYKYSFLASLEGIAALVLEFSYIDFVLELHGRRSHLCNTIEEISKPFYFLSSFIMNSSSSLCLISVTMFE